MRFFKINWNEKEKINKHYAAKKAIIIIIIVTIIITIMSIIKT